MDLDNAPKPEISVIIPAHNEEEQIVHTLNSLVEQSHFSFEVIVVANGCTDNTLKKAEQFNSALKMKTISTTKKGIGRSSNLGFGNSSGKIIVFLDADTCLANDSLHAISTIVKEGYVGGTIRMETKEKRKRYEILKFLQRTVIRLERHTRMAV